MGDQDFQSKIASLINWYIVGTKTFNHKDPRGMRMRSLIPTSGSLGVIASEVTLPAALGFLNQCNLLGPQYCREIFNIVNVSYLKQWHANLF